MPNPKYGTTVANTVLTIQVSQNTRTVWVESVDGAALVYFTIDGSTPAIGADGSFYLPAAPGGLELAVSPARAVTVKLISSAAVKVSVRSL